MSATETRNVVAPETAERNRTEPLFGGYTFNAFVPEDYAGTILEFGVVRIGDHAHIHVKSGRQTPQPHSIRPSTNVGFAGKLCLRWHEWLVLREVLDADLRIRIAEVEKPTQGMAKRYAGARP